MLNFNPDGKKVILSVDGGGMRGLIPIAMLAELEAMTGKPAYELFDMVAGTSTGAVIAGGLALHLSAHDILEQIYKSRLPGAFPLDTFLSNLATYGRFLLTGLRYLYDLEPFRQALQPLAQGKKLRDLTQPIFFVTTKDVRSGDTYYVVSAGPGLSAFADWPLAGAVAASGAAPIYFPPVAGNLIDGGVGVYSNPCLAVATEAMEYIGATEGFVDDQVMLVSLGTGLTPRAREDGVASRFWLFDWVNYVILSGIDDASLQQVFVTRAIYSARLDFRRYNPLLSRESVERELGVPTDNLSDPAQLTLSSRRSDQIALMEAIGRAYARRIDWTRAHVMPWDTPGGQAKPDMATFPVDWSKTGFR